MKNNMLIWWRPFDAVLLMLVLALGTTTALATQIQGFNDPAFYNWSTYDSQQTVGGSNIFAFNPLSGVDEHLSVTGGRWLAAFIVTVPGVGDAVIGYADNDNDSGLGPDYLIGYYSSVLNTYGGIVQKMWLVHDVASDGIGNVVGGVWFNSFDDVVYTEQDILFGTNRVRGDISQLPHYGVGVLFLPQMVVNPIPEPATIAVLALGGFFLSKRSKQNKRKVFMFKNVNSVQVSAVKNEAVLCGGLLLAILVFAVMMWMGTTTALATRISSFSELGSTSLWVHSYYTPAPLVVDNLMVRNLAGVDSIVPLGSKWNLGFAAEGYLVGYADNIYSNVEGQQGWLDGGYNSILDDGHRPEKVFLVYDSTGNGWDFVDGMVGSSRDLLDGDMFFTEADILFGPAGLRGDLGGVGLLPPYSDIGDVGVLPHMVLVIPEPATIAVLALGGFFLRKRKH